MKRVSQKLPYTLHEVTPYRSLFVWRECHFCKMEFRREKGWQFVIQGRFIAYSCMTCCTRPEEVDHKRPPAPEAPPPMRRGDGRYEHLPWVTPCPKTKPPKER